MFSTQRLTLMDRKYFSMDEKKYDTLSLRTFVRNVWMLPEFKSE